MSIYAITADYRPNNPDKPVYYVEAKSSAEAKQRFQSKITWLKVYKVVKLEKEDIEQNEMLQKYGRHIILG